MARSIPLGFVLCAGNEGVNENRWLEKQRKWKEKEAFWVSKEFRYLKARHEWVSEKERLVEERNDLFRRLSVHFRDEDVLRDEKGNEREEKVDERLVQISDARVITDERVKRFKQKQVVESSMFSQNDARVSDNVEVGGDKGTQREIFRAECHSEKKEGIMALPSVYGTEASPQQDPNDSFHEKIEPAATSSPTRLRQLRVLNVHQYVHNAIREQAMRSWLANRKVED